MTPIETVADELERLGYSLDDLGGRGGIRLFLLGYAIGGQRDALRDPDRLRAIVRSLYDPSECRSTSTSTTRTSAPASPG